MVVQFSLRAKSKNVWFCCTLLEGKVEWFDKVALVASLLKMSVMALGRWSIMGEEPKAKVLILALFPMFDMQYFQNDKSDQIGFCINCVQAPCASQLSLLS